ncbi:hypothetical protein RB195_015554 [Necator americanus]|uniref:GSKIP domain-containing protein n=1 Tax=Necator americanus TaxID=51031 RepID=A0ABR1E552_NECAM
MTICHNNARTFASDVAIEDLMMQASKFKNAVIRLTETRQCHPHNLVYETAEGQFLETSNSCGVGGVSVFVNTNMTMNIDSFEQITTRIGSKRFCQTDLMLFQSSVRFRKIDINRDLFAMPAASGEDSAKDNIDEEYDLLVGLQLSCRRKAESFETIKRRLSPAILELIRRRVISSEV